MRIRTGWLLLALLLPAALGAQTTDYGVKSTADPDDPATAALWEAVDRDDAADVAARLGIRPDDSLTATVHALAAWRADSRRTATIARCPRGSCIRGASATACTTASSTAATSRASR